MITVKDFMETINYKITEGSNFQWTCWGSNAYSLDSFTDDTNGHNISIVFDTETQEVYEAVAHDYRNNRSYRLLNPLYAEEYKNEALIRMVNPNEATDDINFIDLENDYDFLEKARAISNNQHYDTRVSVPLELNDDLIFQLMKMAHEKDITLNQLVENILQEELKNFKNL